MIPTTFHIFIVAKDGEANMTRRGGQLPFLARKDDELHIGENKDGMEQIYFVYSSNYCVDGGDQQVLLDNDLSRVECGCECVVADQCCVIADLIQQYRDEGWEVEEVRYAEQRQLRRPESWT